MGYAEEEDDPNALSLTAVLLTSTAPLQFGLEQHSNARCLCTACTPTQMHPLESPPPPLQIYSSARFFAHPAGGRLRRSRDL